MAADHCKENDADRPDVAEFRQVPLAGYHLRRCVAGRATSCLKETSRLECVAKAEIYDFYILVGIEKEILGFEVSMDHEVPVNDFNACDNLPKKLARFVFFESLRFDNVVE